MTVKSKSVCRFNSNYIIVTCFQRHKLPQTKWATRKDTVFLAWSLMACDVAQFALNVSSRGYYLNGHNSFKTANFKLTIGTKCATHQEWV